MSDAGVPSWAPEGGFSEDKPHGRDQDSSVLMPKVRAHHLHQTARVRILK